MQQERFLIYWIDIFRNEKNNPTRVIPSREVTLSYSNSANSSLTNSTNSFRYSSEKSNFTPAAS